MYILFKFKKNYLNNDDYSILLYLCDIKIINCKFTVLILTFLLSTNILR